MSAPSPRAKVQLTLLSSILGPDFLGALERQKALGLQFLDLKDGLWGKTIEHLSQSEAERAAALIAAFGLSVHCLSTSIGHTALAYDTSEASFRAQHEPALENALRVAQVLRPQVIRLLAPRLSATPNSSAMQRLGREFPG